MYYRIGTVMQLVRKLIGENPKLSIARAKALAMATSRNRFSRHSPHQSTRECARRLRQFAAGRLSMHHTAAGMR
jgi:hypothetical protein